jgi:hypothetical protein
MLRQRYNSAPERSFMHTTESTVRTLVQGYDHAPYSTNFFGVPDDIVNAVHHGLYGNLPEIDPRQMEWDCV